jgi:DNA polymerase-3 subunit delta
VNGENLANAMQQARIYGDRQNLVRKAIARLSLRQLQAAQLKLAEIDKIAKGMLRGDAWLEISRLCFGLAKVNKRAKVA